jgi:hypothetical protein
MHFIKAHILHRSSRNNIGIYPYSLIAFRVFWIIAPRSLTREKQAKKKGYAF